MPDYENEYWINEFRDEDTEGYYDIPPGPPPPDYVPTIKGYGTRVILSKEPGQWTDQYGEPASPDYVKDIENVVDTENISDAALKSRIAEQERIPGRPSDQALNTFTAIADALKRRESEFKKVAETAAGEAEKIYLGRTPTIDAVLMKPAEIAQRDANAKAARLAAYNHSLDTQVNQFKDFAEKHLASQVKENKFPSNDEIIYKAFFQKNGRDPTAQEFLDAKETYALDLKQKETDIASGAKEKGLNVPLLARAVADGQDAPMAIKGSMGNPLAAKVKGAVLELYPKFDFNMSDANYKWKQSATNQRTVNFAGGALPRLGALDDQLNKLQNVDLNVINKVMSVVSKQFGKPEYTNYESNRNAIVQEIGTALSGTSQASDLRIKIELENLESAKSPSQIRGAISNLREALIARLDVDLSPLYPLPVVRGEQTLQQFKDEMFKNFRGKYGKYGEGVIYETSPGLAVGGNKPRLTPAQAIDELRRRRGQR